MDRQQYLNNKFGDINNATKIYRDIFLSGKSAGISFNFHKINLMPNSLKAM